MMAQPQTTTPIDEKVAELLDEFEAMVDWEDRYQLIIEIGDDLAPLPDEYHTPQYKVEGCVSQVWLKHSLQTDNGSAPIVHFSADSDSHLVRGLVAMLVELFSGRPASEILAFDIEGFFGRLRLQEHLSRSRSNGLRAMIRRIHAICEAALR